MGRALNPAPGTLSPEPQRNGDASKQRPSGRGRAAAQRAQPASRIGPLRIGYAPIHEKLETRGQTQDVSRGQTRGPSTRCLLRGPDPGTSTNDKMILDPGSLIVWNLTTRIDRRWGEETFGLFVYSFVRGRRDMFSSMSAASHGFKQPYLIVSAPPS